jgi:hypothetical protein
VLFCSPFRLKILNNSACEDTNIAESKGSLGSSDISWLGVTTVTSDMGHWVTHWNVSCFRTFCCGLFVPVSLLYHVVVSVYNLARDYSHLSVSITWLCLSVCIYHLTMLAGLCLLRDCACRPVLCRVSLSVCIYHVIAPLVCALSRDCAFGLCLSSDCAFGQCSITWLPADLWFITWLCLSVNAVSRERALGFCLSRDWACRSVFITWLRLWSVLYYVTTLVSLCCITLLCLSVCDLSLDRACQSMQYHVTVLVGFCLSRDCACRPVFITWLRLWSVLCYVTALVSLCCITWLCRPVCVYHVTVSVCVCSIIWVCANSFCM